SQPPVPATGGADAVFGRPATGGGRWAVGGGPWAMRHVVCCGDDDPKPGRTTVSVHAAPRSMCSDCEGAASRTGPAVSPDPERRSRENQHDGPGEETGERWAGRNGPRPMGQCPGGGKRLVSPHLSRRWSERGPAFEPLGSVGIVAPCVWSPVEERTRRRRKTRDETVGKSTHHPPHTTHASTHNRSQPPTGSRASSRPAPQRAVHTTRRAYGRGQNEACSATARRTDWPRSPHLHISTSPLARGRKARRGLLDHSTPTWEVLS
ncbi:hypothetical protein JHW43_004008, partial [Diplocarpon mali]